MLNRLIIDNVIFLDDKRLEGVIEYSVIHNEKDDFATLNLKMDVRILKCAQDQRRDVTKYAR